MLVARRDPPFHVDAHDTASAISGAEPTARTPRLARFMANIQLLGSLLAVPVGIASAYSFYRANFSPETTCQNLRSGIVAMLDKNVDAGTRRILVRRDVEAFEKACSAVDPDATAAFKTLLAVEKAAAPATVTIPVVPKGQGDAGPKEAVRKAEPRPQAAAKQPAINAAASAVEAVRRDPAVSDTQWLDAVRQALVTHDQAPPSLDAKAPHVKAPVVRPAPHEGALSAPATAAPMSVVPAPATAAPQTIVISPPVAQEVDADHPVPPASIPDAAPPTDAAKPDEHRRSRIGKWISEIPLLGPIVENGRL